MLQAKEDYVVEGSSLCSPCYDPSLRVNGKFPVMLEDGRNDGSQEGSLGQNLHYKRRVQGCVDLAI